MAATVVGFFWLFPALVGAAGIPGATYAGTTVKGGSVELAVSSDGTLVNSYRIQGLHGTYTTGGQCVFVAGGSPGVWEGAPIVNNAFKYDQGVGAEFQGSFTGPRSMAGTLSIYQPATSESPACSTGTITWTARTKASPTAGHAGGTRTPRKRIYATTVSLRKLSSAKLEGLIRSPNKRCRVHRPVTLWVGALRSGKTQSRANGGFRFVRTATLRGRDVRASVSSLKLASQSCSAASSTFITD